MKLTIQPLTPELWPALEDLFDQQGAVGRCWCMYWRIGNDYRKRPTETNKAALHDLINQGAPTGLLAFDRDLAVGWCQLTPRRELPWLARAWRLRSPDEMPVWSLSCFYIRKGYRKRGVTAALIEAALETARRAGAPALEAYPLDATLTVTTSFTGYLSTFQRAGFKIVTRHVPSRPIVRYEFNEPGDGRASVPESSE